MSTKKKTNEILDEDLRAYVIPGQALTLLELLLMQLIREIRKSK